MEKKKTFLLTRENLERLGAYEDHIAFCEKANLIGLNFYDLKIEGDYRGFNSWLSDTLKEKRTYNEKGLITSRIDASGHVCKWKYDEKGLLILVTFECGTSIKYTYNKQGLVASKSCSGTKTYTCTYTYNEKGQKTAEILSKEHGYRYFYNKQGLCTTIREFSGKTSKFTYNKQGLMISDKCFTGDVKKWRYNKQGLLIYALGADGTTLKFTYNKQGLLTSKTWGGRMEHYSENWEYIFNEKGVLSEVKFNGDTITKIEMRA